GQSTLRMIASPEHCFGLARRPAKFSLQESATMHSLFTFKRLLLLPLLLALVLAGVWAQDYRLFERAWFNASQWLYTAQWQAHSIWLSDYEVVREAQPIEGLDDDVSALTYDPDR